MKMDFPLMSILSVGFLLFFALQGGDVSLHSIEVGFSADSESVTITVDPAFLVWSDQMYPVCWGETFGNVAVVWKPLRGTMQGDWVKRFELNHIAQYRALGWWIMPASFILPIDPRDYNPQHWDDLTEADRVEWLPPDGWPTAWHFLSFNHGLTGAP